MAWSSTQKRIALGALSVFAGALAAFVWLGARRARRYPAPEMLLIEPDEDVWVERGADSKLRLRWRGLARAARVFVGPHPDAIDRAAPLVGEAAPSTITLSDLNPHRPHYFEIAFDDGPPVVVAPRFLPLGGAVNLRDIGGYRAGEGRRVRWGRVYRSGSLADLADADVQALAALGLKTVCDLRTPQEASRYADRLPGGVAYINLPAYNDGGHAEWLKTLIFRRHELDDVMLESYLRMANTRAEIFGDFLRRLTDPTNLPFVVHCTAGKDRTGIAIAFLLLMLGVSEEMVIADYTLSNLEYDRICAAAREDVRRLSAIGLTAEELRPLMSVNARSLRGLLDHVRARHGSLAAYLREAAGVGPDVVARLRENLLE